VVAGPGDDDRDEQRGRHDEVRQVRDPQGEEQVQAQTGHDEQGQNVLKPITCLDEALTAIEHIKEQGEGTPSTPDAPGRFSTTMV